MSGRVNGQSGNGSVRNRMEAAERDAAGDEVVVKLPKNQSSVCASPGFNTNVRDRQRLAAFRAEEANAPTATGSLADANLAEYNRQQAEKDRQREADIASGKLIIIDDDYLVRQHYKQQAELKAKQEAARLEFAITATMQDASATEIAQVKEIIARTPEKGTSPERHWLLLQNLREAFGRQ
jgi:hypothetical protein